MGRLFAVKNLGPAPSMEDLASSLSLYALDYVETYALMDNMDGDQSLSDYAYDSSLQAIAKHPRDVLVYLTTERDIVRVEGAIDENQLPMLDRLIDMTKAYIAARGL